MIITASFIIILKLCLKICCQTNLVANLKEDSPAAQWVMVQLSNIRRSKSSTHYPSDKNRFDVSSKGPSSGISVGGRGKHACFYTSEYIKTTRDKIKTNQMDLIKTRNKYKCKSYYLLNVNVNLLNVNEWLIANKLTLNETKTEFMIIGSRQRVPSFEQGPIIKLGNQVIKRVPNKKTLGVILNEHLTWNKHIDEQNKKISNNIALLRRAKSFVPEHILNKMYNAFVIPNCYYCSTVWNDGHKNKLTKLSKLQKKAARVITGASYDERSNEIFRKLDWMPIHKSLSIRENIVTFKALTANSPNYLTEMFNFCSNETYNLRSNFCQLFLEKPNTNFLKKSFSYRAAKSWNNLPDNIRQNVDNITLNVAKSMLINHYRTD